MLISLALLLAIIIVLIGLSPIALGRIRGFSDDWEDLSFIGQTYGAVSAVLAGVALAGVIATLVVQAREMRISREIALRDSNSELLRMAMESEEYGECWGANLSGSRGTAQRQSMYTNMIISQWEMAYESRAMGDDHVRALARKLFVGRIGWEFWNRVRHIRIETSDSRRARRFHRVVDSEFHRSPEPPPDMTGSRPEKVRTSHRGVGAVSLAFCAIAAGAVFARRQKRGTVKH